MKDDSISNSNKQQFGIPKLYSNRTKEGFFKVDPELWSRFKGECASRGVSICHVLETLMLAWIEGQKVMSTVVQPVVINLNMEHVVQRPRRMIDAWEPRLLLWPPNCEYANKFFTDDRSVGCMKTKNIVSIKECYACYRESNYAEHRR